MQTSRDLRKAVITGAGITAFSVTASVVPVWIWLQIDPVIDLASIYISAFVLPLLISPTCAFFILRAQLRAERLARENFRLANRDDLTGLPNRRAFFKAAEALKAKAGPGAGTLYCAIADIDFFKRVNDAFGHDAGDRVLQSVGGTLLANCPAGGTAARLGGEEFAVAGLFPDAQAARAYFAALVGTVRAASCGYEDMRLSVTISLGYCAAEAGDSVSILLSRADQALYRAKGNGKDRAENADDLPAEARWDAPRRSSVPA